MANKLAAQVTYYPYLNDYTSSTYRNYVRTFIPQVPLTSESAITFTDASSNCVVNTAYIDGLGRPLQEVAYKAVNGTYDLVTVHVYDSLGREAVKYLPFASNASNDASYITNRGKLKPNPKTLLSSQYNSLYPDDQPFSETLYDNSPLNQVTQNMAPGASWVGSGVGVSYKYRTNSALAMGDNVAKWSVDPVGNLVYGGIYDDGELNVTMTTDENGHTITEYKDKAGMVIFKNQLALQKIVELYPGDEILVQDYQQIYYVYDNLNELIWVITPDVVAQYGNEFTSSGISSSMLNGYCYNYIYDGYGRIVEKKIPGKGREYIVYDQHGRVAFTQDGNDASGSNTNNDTKLLYSPTGPVYSATSPDGNFWHFNYYDPLGRVIATGLYQPTLIYWGRSYLQDAVNTVAYTSDVTDLLYYQTNDLFNTYPASMTNAIVLTKNYYDNYSSPDLAGKAFSAALNAEVTSTDPTTVAPTVCNITQTRGQLTGSNVSIINPNAIPNLPTSLITANFYDFNGRLIQAQAMNHCTGIDTMTNEYDFAGHEVASVLHANNPKAVLAGLTNPHQVQATSVVKKYNIDHANGTLDGITQSINGSAFEPIYLNNYDALGRVSNKVVNVASNCYNYNIRGWMTGINSGYFNNNIAEGIYFREKLDYNQATDGLTLIPYYNGNIAASIWQGYGAGAPMQSYVYNYDSLNRLTNALYNELDYTLSGGTYVTDNIWNHTHTNYSASNIAYDLNGNLSTMSQMGPSTSGGAPVLMDSLTYSYIINTNQLGGVADNATAVTTDPDFKDDPAHSLNDYTYDLNGNLISDNNKGITAIEYGNDNKPEQLTVTGKGQINYVYDALGNKLEKIVTNTATASSDTTDYVGPFEYNNKALMFMSHEEGRSLPQVTSGTLSYLSNYYLKDHLGNVRSVVQATPATGPPFLNYLATHELAEAALEGQIWSNIDNVRADRPGAVDTVNLKAATLLGTDSIKRIGTSIMLSVMPGDQFALTANSYYPSFTSSQPVSTSSLISTLLNTLAGGTNSVGTPVSELGQTQQTLNAAINNPGFSPAYGSLLSSAPYDSTLPAAYLNYIVMDNNFKVIASQSGAIQISGEAGEWTAIGLSGNITVTQAGYLLAFISSNDANAVSFDDMQLTYYQGSEIEEDHYYPFGLTLQTASSETPAQVNNIKYNSKELQHNEFADASGVKSGLELYDYGARMQDMQLGRWLQVDPMAEKYPNISPYTFCSNNPISRVDPTGAADDWVENGSGNVSWDKNATSQATTPQGETYLGKTLTFNFNSYIDAKLWDGPNSKAPGNKLTSVITLTGQGNAAGELTGITATKSIELGQTPIGTPRDYFPGLGDNQNKFGFSGTTSNDGQLSTTSFNFEQHASVSRIEEVGLNMMGYDIVDVAQSLQLNFSNNKLSIAAGTDVFPSATLTLNGQQLFKYNQPSFKATYGRSSSNTDNGMGGINTQDVQNSPAPAFYNQYQKK